MIEKWLPIIGYETYYEVSNLGRIRSLDRIITRKCKHNTTIVLETRKYQKNIKLKKLDK